VTCNVCLVLPDCDADQPGTFGPRTHELGQYMGIRVDGALAATAGERMRLYERLGFHEAQHAPPHGANAP
jgi:hypothetical protein